MHGVIQALNELGAMQAVLQVLQCMPMAVQQRSTVTRHVSEEIQE